MADRTIGFCNHYYCPACCVEWSDVWSVRCDDRCPICNAETEPYSSDDVPPENREAVARGSLPAAV